MARIIVVDDQPYVRATVVAPLRASGFDVVDVEDAASALRALESDRFDLAIVDVYMPNVDGVKLIKALRERWPELPVIAMSGVFIKDSGRTALEFLPQLPGLADVICLKKPFRAATLLQAVRTALAVAA